MFLFLDIINIVLPVFSVIALGWLLRQWKLIDAVFLKQTNKLVYYVCLPLLLFYKIGTADFFANFNGKLIVGSIAAVAITFQFFHTSTLSSESTRTKRAACSAKPLSAATLLTWGWPSHSMLMAKQA